MAPPRSSGLATLYFGLVGIRVKLYSATSEPPSLSFALLHKDCGARAKQQYICPRDKTVLEREALAKGYEVTKDRFVVFEPETLKAIEETPDPAVDVVDYVLLERIDPVYFDKPYNVAPEPGSERAYAVMAQALAQAGLVGLGLHATRGRQLLVCVRSTGSRLVLQQLLRAEQVRPVDEVLVPGAPVAAPELRLALQLVQAGAIDRFDPGGYPDKARERTLALVAEKVAGHEITVAPPEDGRPAFAELADALKASLATHRVAPRRAVRSAPAAKARSAARK
jgi:DNA end-binding protein Ku